MKEQYGDIGYEIINSMIVLSGTVVGREPDKEIRTIMNRLAKAYQLVVLRSFGFDIYVDISRNDTGHRGYEYWLSIDEPELKKLPNDMAFIYEGYDICVKRIPPYRYARLRIEEPFTTHDEKIGDGWRRLLRWLETHDYKETGIVKCDNAYCLEEIRTVEEIVVLDIYVPVARLNKEESNNYL